MSVLVTRADKDGLAILTLNRPDKLNSLTVGMFRELREQEYMLKQQYAGSLTQSSVRATFADSLSQYSKHSDDMGGHGTEVEVRSTN